MKLPQAESIPVLDFSGPDRSGELSSVSRAGAGKPRLGETSRPYQKAEFTGGGYYFAAGSAGSEPAMTETILSTFRCFLMAALSSPNVSAWTRRGNSSTHSGP